MLTRGRYLLVDLLPSCANMFTGQNVLNNQHLSVAALRGTYQPFQEVGMSCQKITVHCGIGGNPRGIGDYFRRLDAAGRPAAVCSYDNYGIVKELIDLRIRSRCAAHSVFRPNIYRPHLPDQNPDYNKQPEAAGRDCGNSSNGKSHRKYATPVTTTTSRNIKN